MAAQEGPHAGLAATPLFQQPQRQSFLCSGYRNYTSTVVLLTLIL